MEGVGSIEGYDGFEAQQVQEAVKRSMMDSTPRAPTNMTTVVNIGDTLYAAARVWIDTQPHTRSKGRIQGTLALKNMDGEVILEWVPSLKKKAAGINYEIRHTLAECFSFKGEGSKVAVILAADGGPGASLPPFQFDVGNRGVREFLGYMQVNLAPMCANAPYVRIDPGDRNRFLVHRNSTSQSAMATTPEIVGEQAAAVGNELAFKALEAGANFNSFLRNAAHAAGNLASATFTKTMGTDTERKAPFAAALRKAGAPGEAQSSLLMSDLNEMLDGIDAAEEQGLAAKQAVAEQEAREKETRRRSGTLLSTARSTLGELGDFDVIDEVAPIQMLKPCQRKSPITKEKWDSFFDSNGVVNDDSQAELRKSVFHGGVSPEIRREVWMYLLGHRAPSDAQKDDFHEERREKYLAMKQQWSSVSEVQMSRNKYLRERAERVQKDVMRTDRDDPFFMEDSNPNLKILNDVLMTWCAYNFDLGYVQGMSDLVSMILRVVRDEVDTFWCFIGMMDSPSGLNLGGDPTPTPGGLPDAPAPVGRTNSSMSVTSGHVGPWGPPVFAHNLQVNFAIDQKGIQGQLDNLRRLIRFFDPRFMDFLEDHDSGNLFFMFRWILIRFKREFSIEDTYVLWEVLWSQHLSPKFHLFVCLAIVHLHRNKVITENLAFDELLAYANSLSGQLNLDEVLGMAEATYRSVAERDDVPSRLMNIIQPGSTGDDSVKAPEPESPPTRPPPPTSSSPLQHQGMGSPPEEGVVFERTDSEDVVFERGSFNDIGRGGGGGGAAAATNSSSGAGGAADVDADGAEAEEPSTPTGALAEPSNPTSTAAYEWQDVTGKWLPMPYTIDSAMCQFRADGKMFGEITDENGVVFVVDLTPGSMFRTNTATEVVHSVRVAPAAAAAIAAVEAATAAAAADIAADNEAAASEAARKAGIEAISDGWEVEGGN